MSSLETSFSGRPKSSDASKLSQPSDVVAGGGESNPSEVDEDGLWSSFVAVVGSSSLRSFGLCRSANSDGKWLLLAGKRVSDLSTSLALEKSEDLVSVLDIFSERLPKEQCTYSHTCTFWVCLWNDEFGGLRPTIRNAHRWINNYFEMNKTKPDSMEWGEWYMTGWDRMG